MMITCKSATGLPNLSTSGTYSMSYTGRMSETLISSRGIQALKDGARHKGYAINAAQHRSSAQRNSCWRNVQRRLRPNEKQAEAQDRSRWGTAHRPAQQRSEHSAKRLENAKSS